jgi:hypothetical protein
MLRLNLSAGPERLDLGHGVEILVEPLSSTIFAAAQADPLVAALEEGCPRPVRALVFAKALARIAILDWDGVGNEDGEPVDSSPDLIDLLLDVKPIYDRFTETYVAKGLLLSAEKKDFAPSPTGTSAAATDSVRPVPDPAPSAPPS